MRSVLILLLAIGLISCDSGDSGPPQLDGQYQIQYELTGTRTTIEMDLIEENGSISGDGSITIEDLDTPEARTGNISVSGSHDHPDLSLEITVLETGSVSTYAGEVQSEDRATGTLTTPDGTNLEVPLERP